MERKTGNGSRCKGCVTVQEEFLYPDSKPGALPEEIRIVMAKNGRPGIQLLFETAGKNVRLFLEENKFTAECFRMKAVPVEYNTGDGTEQGGAMVLKERPQKKPDYVTRLAPFYVYDCLIPAQSKIVETEGGFAAVYLCISAKPDTLPGEYDVKLSVALSEGVWKCRLHIKVYDVEIPEDTFFVTNWFSEDSICKFHHVQKGTEHYLEMLRLYISAMRRMHQNVFYIQLDERCIASENPQEFDFEYLTPVIKCFFDGGMKQIELGTLLHRGFLPDGMPDMYTGDFVCTMKKDLLFDTPEGYAHTVRLVRSLSEYLKEHGWEKQVLFHIHDEPDIHFKTKETLETRRRQYYLAANILRKYLPEVKIIEAVDTVSFYGGIDIWVPGTAGYDDKKQQFDMLAELGETIWTYVCCSPEGKWLNRFLDFDLIRGRLLFWGCARNRISGFLHWGFNQFPGEMNPFEGTSCPNDTGIGTNFPCGDSFLVYPGENGPYIGMRLEAQRRGIEDAALWGLLYRKNKTLWEQLLDSVFTKNNSYNSSPDQMERVYEQLLEALVSKESQFVLEEK